MKRTSSYYVACSVILVTALIACSSTTTLLKSDLVATPAAAPRIRPVEEAVSPSPSPARAEKIIELKREIDPKFKHEATELNADLYKPAMKLEPKTLVLLVPGTGQVSRRGEMSSNGISKYPKTVELYAQWANALAEHGLFVLAYDKRTCKAEINKLCREKKPNEALEESIEILARDLDDIYSFAQEKLGKSWRIVLMGHTQSAQVIALSRQAKQASGIVLLSPITEGLDTMLVRGFEQAHRRNDAEGQKSFFARLDKGEFAENAVFFGGSARLWKSWLNASRRTMEHLGHHNRPTLMLFSEKDVFNSSESAEHNAKKYGHRQNLAIKKLDEDIDRNLLENGMLAKSAVDEVIHFIKNLKLSAMTAKL